jgi:hypothetical protein
MGDQKQTEKKPAKKLELNKETIQELSESELDGVAGGIGNSVGICKGTEKPVPISDNIKINPDTTPHQCPEHPS